ncbi:tetratricopeptide repeat protein [Aquimarina spongiae]|uniref:TPR repeat-containing protein n=1 Tax=Aquimarina spongiae TaxID=570521 RepID=A0A1M6KGM7_9FLAO|nr:tetratricopeptide repeat protein [Aquimarina spongiae]SHJ58113.1 TPR repeat-containing protein [Aquimarina spongiae]
MVSNFSSKNLYRNLFIGLSVFLGILMMYLSTDYGPLEDTRIHQDHGVRILNYFKGIDKKAALTPVDDQGNYYDVNKNLDSEEHGMNGFGGFFDLVSNFLHQFYPSSEIYAFKNFVNSIFGFLLFLFCGLIGKELRNWKLGVLTLIFVTLTPVMFGYSMNNPKDIPAAAFYIIVIFHNIKLLKELPAISLKRSFYLILNISLLINIRVIGLITIGYVVLGVFLWWLLENKKHNFTKIHKKDSLFLGSKVLAICVASYIAVSIFWPYAQTNPFKVPIEILIKMGEFRGFENLQLFEGVWKSSFDMPWYYAIKNLFIIMMPLHAFLGFFLIPILYFRTTKEQMLYVSMILFASVFPMLLVVVGKPNSHDGSRQFMFSVMPIVVLSAFSWYKLFGLIPKKNLVKVVFGLMILLMLEPLRFMIQYHPMQALYFSPIVGGVSGAYGNYEIDYYGVAVKPSLDWLDKNVGDSKNPPRVRLYYGSQMKIKSYLDRNPNLQYALSKRESSKWDYSIIMLAEGKYKRDLDVNWSPKNTVHEIKVDGISLCYIVKNDYKGDDYFLELQQNVANSPSANGFIDLGLVYFNKTEYVRSIEAFKMAINIDPSNSLAYNNICSAFNRLKMYEKAQEACEKAISLRPDFDLAKNNLLVSKNRISRSREENLTVKEYLNLSYNYYRLGFFKECIDTCEKLLEIDPDNVIAYNNICSSYNNLEDYENAIKACEKALEINPNYEVARNNLDSAKKKIGD